MEYRVRTGLDWCVISSGRRYRDSYNANWYDRAGCISALVSLPSLKHKGGKSQGKVEQGPNRKGTTKVLLAAAYCGGSS
jgi:hypothetical protein